MADKKTGKHEEVKRVTKKSLKKIRKTRNQHPLRTEARVIKYGTSGFSRNIWLSSAATVVMMVTLIILFVTVVASVILTNTAEIMKEKIDITIYIKPNTSQEAYTELSDILKKDSNVKSVTTANSDEEYAKLRNENAGSTEITTILDDEEMQQMMASKVQGTIRIKVNNVDDLSSIKSLVETNPTFQYYLDDEKEPSYDANQAEIATITNWARIARAAGLGFAVVFLVISILIIFSTIRMAIFSRREEIYMRKLVGAEKRFIRGPFLVEAEICGIIALAPKLESYGIDISSITSVLQSNQLIIVYAIFVLVGVLISRISASLAVSKYLHKT